MFPSCVASRRNGCPFLIFGLFSEQSTVHQESQLQCTAKALFSSALQPGNGSLPSGILAEQHPHCKGCTSAFLHFLPRRADSLHLRRICKCSCRCEGLGKLHSIQQLFHRTKKLHQTSKGVPCGKIRIVQSPTQDTVLIIIYAHQCHPAFVSPCPVLHPRNTSFPITRNPLTWSVYHSAVTKPVTFSRSAFKSHLKYI